MKFPKTTRAKRSPEVDDMRHFSVEETLKRLNPDVLDAIRDPDSEWIFEEDKVTIRYNRPK